MGMGRKARGFGNEIKFLWAKSIVWSKKGGKISKQGAEVKFELFIEKFDLRSEEI